MAKRARDGGGKAAAKSDLPKYRRDVIRTYRKV